MSDILSSLSSMIDSNVVKQLAGQLGSDEQKTGSAVSAAIPALVTALANNAKKPEGAAALDKALEKDHDGSILDDVGGFLGGAGSGKGASILAHVLGGKQQGVEAALGKQSGLSGSQVGQLMATVAPLVLGALGKQKREQGMDASGLAGALQQEKASASGGAGDMLTSLLDADGDGDVMDDIAEKGAGLLGGLFGKK